MVQNQFKIIRILSDKEFIIDGGSNDGVEIDQKFKILDPNSNPIKDLNDEIIGYLGSQKCILVAYDVRDTFTVLKTEYVESHTESTLLKNNIAGLAQTGPLNQIHEMMFNESIPAHNERANIDPAEMEPIEDSEEPIHKGDLAILIS